ncbi:MAG: hypothetical protein AAFU68_02845 [Pseudomonadota bacterium]
MTPHREWTQHSEYHLSLTLAGRRLDYWPSSGRYRWEGKTHRLALGNRAVDTLFCPECGERFKTLSDLTAHFEYEHPADIDELVLIVESDT